MNGEERNQHASNWRRRTLQCARFWRIVEWGMGGRGVAWALDRLLETGRLSGSAQTSTLQIQTAQEGGRQQSSWTTSEGLLLLDEKGDSVWATISTPTGDYRYLAGKKESNQLVFSNFDGAHLFRFSATVEGDSMINGTFLSGTHYETSFEGVRLPNNPCVWTSGQQRANGKPLVFRGVNATGRHRGLERAIVA